MKLFVFGLSAMSVTALNLNQEGLLDQIEGEYCPLILSQSELETSAVPKVQAQLQPVTTPEELVKYQQKQINDAKVLGDLMVALMPETESEITNAATTTDLA